MDRTAISLALLKVVTEGSAEITKTLGNGRTYPSEIARVVELLCGVAAQAYVLGEKTASSEAE